MAGSLTNKGHKKWGCRIYVGRHEDTRRRVYRYETYHGTKKQAEKHLRKMLHKRDEGEYNHLLRPDDPSDMLRDFLDWWLDAKQGSVVDRTLDGYKSSVENRINPALGDLPLTDVTPDRLTAFFSDLHKHGGKNGKPLSARTVRKTHSVLRNALEMAVAREMIPSNPARNKIVRDSLPKKQSSDANANGRTVQEYISCPASATGSF